jgi:hypothetical protein
MLFEFVSFYNLNLVRKSLTGWINGFEIKQRVLNIQLVFKLSHVGSMGHSINIPPFLTFVVESNQLLKGLFMDHRGLDVRLCVANRLHDKQRQHQDNNRSRRVV